MQPLLLTWRSGCRTHRPSEHPMQRVSSDPYSSYCFEVFLVTCNFSAHASVSYLIYSISSFRLKSSLLLLLPLPFIDVNVPSLHKTNVLNFCTVQTRTNVVQFLIYLNVGCPKKMFKTECKHFTIQQMYWQFCTSSKIWYRINVCVWNWKTSYYY